MNAGHRPDTPMLIGVHGSVYNIGYFLPIHPGGPLIAAAAAGQDASEVFDEFAHTSNPEVMSLLSKYFIGHMSPKPDFNSTEITEIYDLWRGYLKSSVDCLTNVSFEVKDIIEDCQKTWFNKLGELDSGGVRKMYQLQSRFMQGGLSVLFGVRIPYPRRCLIDTNQQRQKCKSYISSFHLSWLITVRQTSACQIS